MSEFIGTRCDLCALIVDFEPIDALDEGWQEDDKGQHYCPHCIEVGEDLQATGEGLETFGELVGQAADAVLEDPAVVALREEARDRFEIIKKNAVDAFVAGRQVEGKGPSTIEAEVASLIQDLEEAFNQRYGELKIGE